MKALPILVLSSCLVLITLKSSAQSTVKNVKFLDTIYTNDQKNVALFFPTPIRQGITGSDHFVFTYNREKQQHFGLLQARPGPESNLLVIGSDGSVFSYIVRYREQLHKVNYFFDKADKIGYEKPMEKKSFPSGKQEAENTSKRVSYHKSSSVLIRSSQKIGNIRKKKYDVTLQVRNIVFDKGELYFVIQIKNNSSLDYDPGFLELYVETRKKGKKKSLQSLKKDTLYTYKSPERIVRQSTVTMVYVFSKFSLDKDHRALLKLGEFKGQRNIALRIPKRFINNPN